MNLAVVTTYNRPEVLRNCITTIRPQVDDVFIVTNGQVNFAFDDANIHILPVDSDPVNLSYLWNTGLDAAMRLAQRNDCETWNVAVLNDDVLVPPRWFASVSQRMRETNTSAACSRNIGNEIIHQIPGPVNLFTRLVGWAFILAGECVVRADERLHWWFGDDDIDWKSRQLGGTLCLPFTEVLNLYPNGLMTPELHAQTGRDGAMFQEIWGMRPW